MLVVKKHYGVAKYKNEPCEAMYYSMVSCNYQVVAVDIVRVVW